MLRNKKFVITCLYTKKGFTLVELAVVLVIIGVLVSVVLVNVGSFTSQARDTKRAADLRNTQVLINSYMTKLGYMPKTAGWGSLQTALQDAGVINGDQALPQDPSKNTSYEYTPCQDATSLIYNHYIVSTVLETVSSTFFNSSYQPSKIPTACTPDKSLPSSYGPSFTCAPGNQQYCIYF